MYIVGFFTLCLPVVFPPQCLFHFSNRKSDKVGPLLFSHVWQDNSLYLQILGSKQDKLLLTYIVFIVKSQTDLFCKKLILMHLPFISENKEHEYLSNINHI